MTRTWFDEMKDHLEAHQAEIQARREKREAEARAQFERRHTPMSERVARIIRAMPESERDKPRHLDFFVKALRSKWAKNGQAADREVADALRSLGWNRRRIWQGTGLPQVTLWHPPMKQPARKRARKGTDARAAVG